MSLCLSGKGSSAAGLTAAVMRDRHGVFSLEASGAGVYVQLWGVCAASGVCVVLRCLCGGVFGCRVVVECVCVCLGLVACMHAGGLHVSG